MEPGEYPTNVISSVFIVLLFDRIITDLIHRIAMDLYNMNISNPNPSPRPEPGHTFKGSRLAGDRTAS
jgi:hypothetical protein